ncbi:MAG TPA: hypothetical protein VG076_09215 [Acidimicrobiales bacterium]|jgi:hypothetical protein|nr:hypothetical protein [Acidimicrobiales bacterium]
MPRFRRLLVGISIVATAALASLVAPAPASAGTCYQVQAGPQWVTVCT